MKNLKEIAAELGLSSATISRVVNNKSTVSEETRARVLEALERCEYRPNLVARSLKSRSTHTIGVVIPDITERFFGRVIKAVIKTAEEAGYGVLLCDSGEDRGREALCLRELSAKRIDGVILATVDASGRTAEDLDVPAVLIDNEPESCRGRFDAVLTDNEEAGRLGCRALLDAGCTKIGIIAGRQDETTGHDRFIGWQSALRGAGLPCSEERIRFGDFKEASGYIAMRELLPVCDGVFVSSSKMAVGALLALRDAGRTVPGSFVSRDLRLSAVDFGEPFAALLPEIPSVLQREEEIGVRAVSLLLDRIASPGLPCRRILLPPMRHKV